MIGLDSGFFVELIRKNSVAVKVWEGIVGGNESAVSCLTFYELKRLSLTGAIDPVAVDTILEAIRAISKVVWLDNAEIFAAAANMSQSQGIHVMDALILASLVSLNVKTIYTTDIHFEKYKKKSVSVALLSRDSSRT